MEERLSPTTTCEVLAEAAKCLREPRSEVTLLTDSGVENVNATVDGRRNFLFTGSVRGGERLAVAYTLVDNSLILGVDPHAYLVDIITKLESGWPLSRLSELTPANWFAVQQATQQRIE